VSSRRALILGVSGQDGAYLAELLLGKGYEVIGASRDAQVSAFTNLRRLGIRERVRVESAALNDFRSVLQLLMKNSPDEVYNLAGQSSVALSFQQPVETLDSISLATLNVLEAIRFTGRPIRFYSACSGECFGDTEGLPADETTPFRPRSPYAVAKAAAYWQVANYREAYGLWACSGILFNHESPLRPERFVTRKVVAAVARIAAGAGETLSLGNMAVRRDWGWAPEYVDAMWRMLQRDQPEDFVIATGESHTLEDFVDEAFQAAGLSWREHVTVDPGLLRPSDLTSGRANATKAEKLLGWRARLGMRDVVKAMLEAESRRETA
jgi:GDPmannose 4,6-dehydratase